MSSSDLSVPSRSRARTEARTEAQTPAPARGRLAREKVGKLRMKDAPLLARLTLIALLIPAGISVGPLLLDSSRTLFLVVTVPLLLRLLSGAYGRIRVPDLMILFYTLWTTVAIFINTPATAVQFAGSQALMTLGAYLAGRASVRDARSFAAITWFLAVSVLISLPFGIYETITGHPIVLQLFGSLPGVHVPTDPHSARRLGLDRVQYVFPHSILYGTYCTMTFSLIWVGLSRSLGMGRRVSATAGVVLGSVISISSAAILSLVLQGAFFCWSVVTGRMKGKWWLLTGLAILGYEIVDMLSSRPAIVAILSRLTFNTSNLYYRVTLFDVGLKEMAAHPFFGIGLGRWELLPDWMISSVDNHWLLISVSFGLPAFFALLLMFLVPILKLGARSFPPGSALAAYRRGWIFSMVSLMLVMITVALYGTMLSIAFFVFAAGLWMLDAEEERPPDDAAEDPGEDPGATGARHARSGSGARYSRR